MERCDVNYAGVIGALRGQSGWKGALEVMEGRKVWKWMEKGGGMEMFRAGLGAWREKERRERGDKKNRGFVPGRDFIFGGLVARRIAAKGLFVEILQALIKRN